MISSTANSYVKHLRSLRDSAKERRGERSLLLEGVRLVAQALAAGASLRVALYAPEQLAATPEGSGLLTALAGQPGCHEAAAAMTAGA
ncbi:MAG: RNA methyltransferase, partial [Chloroflexales bacterium]|nr:RNA methyltransferase [Chloroflexales bacterium]